MDASRRGVARMSDIQSKADMALELIRVTGSPDKDVGFWDVASVPFEHDVLIDMCGQREARMLTIDL